MRPVHLFLLLLMNLCWASVYSAYKILALPTGGIVTLRFGLAAVVLLLAWRWLPGTTPRGGDLVKCCLMGLILCVVGQRLQVYGNQIGTAGNSAVLMSLEPLVASLVAALFLKEHLGPRRLTGFALGMTGVALLNGAWRPDFQMINLSASLLFIASFICEALYSVMGKPIMMRASMMKMLAISLAVGTGTNLLIDGESTFLAAKGLSPTAWLLIVYLGIICTAVGYIVWFIVIRECPMNVAALTIFAQTVFGVAIAALWIGEKLRWEHLFGSIAIASGLAVGLSGQLRSNKPETQNIKSEIPNKA
jgi:drug/metabolite transporter (DMT)-like permease